MARWSAQKASFKAPVVWFRGSLMIVRADLALAMQATKPTIFISAGEASGELYGARLAEILRREIASRGVDRVDLFGMGGERMRAAGVECVVRAEEMAVMGFTEVLKHLPRIYGEFRRLKQAIRERHPAVAVLIDYPDFHFRLLPQLRRLGIPVIYFVSPQLWAWKKRRIKQVQRYVKRMLVIFPFEEQFYRKRGVDAEFVGHPLAELKRPEASREEFARVHALDPARTWIALLPGSRMREIREHLPTMLEAARMIAERKPGESFEFVVPLAPTLNAAQRLQVLELVAGLGGAIRVRPVEDAQGALWNARASVVASGTATVEAALAGNPFVVIYRVSGLTYAIAKRIVTVPHVAMANLIVGRRVVPELIQHDFTAQNIVQQLEPLLPDGGARESMIEGLRSVYEALGAGRGPGDGEGAIERVAAAVMEELGLGAPATS